MSLDEFWESSEQETAAMAIAWSEAREMEHRSRAWFFGHLILCTGNFKEKPKPKRVIDMLLGPYAKTFTISNKTDALEFQERFGVDLLPEGDNGRPE